MNFEKFKELVKNTDDENQYTDYEACRNCEHEFTCCEYCPCELHPSDLANGVTKESILNLIKTGLVELCVTTRGRHFLRMKMVDDGSLFTNKCIALTDNGCALPFSSRPYYGRKTFPCKLDDYTESEVKQFDIDGVTDAWKQYEDILNDCITK